MIMVSYAKVFGLPPGEAIDKGVLVIANNLYGFMKIAGDYPVIFREPPEDLVRAVEKFGHLGGCCAKDPAGRYWPGTNR